MRTVFKRLVTLILMFPNLINPTYYFKKLKDISLFVIHSNGNYPENKTALIKLADLFVIALITLLFSVSLNCLTLYLLKPELSDSMDSFKEENGLVLFALLLIIIGPIREELWYRLSLKFEPVFLSVSFGVFCHQVISRQFYQVSFYNIEVYPFFRIALALVLGAFLFLVVSHRAIQPKLSSFFETHFKWIFWISCIAFAFSHHHYFASSTTNTLLMPILVLPQLILGFATSYMRLKYGFVYAILFHAIYNSSYFLY